jgi:Ras homolog enriched in brain
VNEISVATLEHLQSLSIFAFPQGTESVPIVIVGNKSDLRPEQRQVSAEEGKKVSDKIQCAWTEASARYNENVARAFELLIAQIEKAQNPGELPEKSNCSLM